MIRVQNRTAKKLPIFFFLISSIFVVIELNIPVYDVYSLYASGIIQLNKTFTFYVSPRYSRCVCKQVVLSESSKRLGLMSNGGRDKI